MEHHRFAEGTRRAVPGKTRRWIDRDCGRFDGVDEVGIAQGLSRNQLNFSTQQHFQATHELEEASVLKGSCAVDHEVDVAAVGLKVACHRRSENLQPGYAVLLQSRIIPSRCASMAGCNLLKLTLFSYPDDHCINLSIRVSKVVRWRNHETHLSLVFVAEGPGTSFLMTATSSVRQCKSTNCCPTLSNRNDVNASIEDDHARNSTQSYPADTTPRRQDSYHWSRSSRSDADEHAAVS